MTELEQQQIPSNGYESISEVRERLEDAANIYEKVRIACEHLLIIEGYLSKENTCSGGDLFDLTQTRFPDGFREFSKNTFLQYLSNLVKDEHSSINCPGRKQGYYSSFSAKVLEELAETPEELNEDGTEVPRARRQKEKLLYPVLESWLAAQGYQASDTANTRSGGKWGNPDIAGISAIDNFMGLSVELVTIEAKVSVEGWEQWIFEAIAHRRFANRSYFAFAHPEETRAKLPKDMRYYAELYNIGVLALFVENDVFDAMLDGKLSCPLEVEDVEVEEIYSAPFNHVQLKYQIDFCSNVLGINCAKKLFQWGNRGN